MRVTHFVLFVVALQLAQAVASAQTVEKPDYAAALKFNSRFLNQLVDSTPVQPHWIGDSDAFWFRGRNAKGIEYIFVDCEEMQQRPLFDHNRLAEALAELSSSPTDATSLALESVSLAEAGRKMRFVLQRREYVYDLQAETLAFADDAGAVASNPVAVSQPDGEHRAFSPDNAAYVFLQGFNLYFVEASQAEQANIKATQARLDDADPAPSPAKRLAALRSWAQDIDENERAIQLTHDGQEELTFYGPRLRSRELFQLRHRMDYVPPAIFPDKTRPHVMWSPDSLAFRATRHDLRGVRQSFLINSVKKSRPILEQFDYPIAGDADVPRTELFIFNRKAKKLTKLPAKWKDESYRDFDWINGQGNRARFTRVDRLRRNLELAEVNTTTGQVKSLIVEQSSGTYVSHQTPYNLASTGEFLWWSERDGWGHYYLYGPDGKFDRQVTAGEFRAGELLKVDERNRTLFFQGNGRESGENPFFNHTYRVALDGGEITLMDPGDANHQPLLAPSGRFLIDTFSAVNQAPKTVLRQADGSIGLELSATDLSALRKTGWRAPEPFTVTAADGTTELRGNMWKPFSFDSNRKYPIIAHVYPGPQMDAMDHEFSLSSGPMQLAQVGFIVVQIGTRGSSPLLSKKYRSHSYGNIRDFALADTKLGLEQLASRHSFIDIERAGIYGHSAGGFMTTTAMLKPPYCDFFKAGVASGGSNAPTLTDDLFYEKYQGMRLMQTPEGEAFQIEMKTNAELVPNLSGQLLLIHGEIDRIVHPAGTMRLVEALIQADKRFDLLILPGIGHFFGRSQAYPQRRTWEFFGKHLLNGRRAGANLLSEATAEQTEQHSER